MRKNYCKFLKMELAVWERPVWTADWRGPVKTTWPDQASPDDATPHNTQHSVIEKPLAAPEWVQRWNKDKSNNLWNAKHVSKDQAKLSWRLRSIYQQADQHGVLRQLCLSLHGELGSITTTNIQCYFVKYFVLIFFHDCCESRRILLLTRNTLTYIITFNVAGLLLQSWWPGTAGIFQVLRESFRRGAGAWHQVDGVPSQERRKGRIPGYLQANHHGVGNCSGCHGGCSWIGENCKKYFIFSTKLFWNLFSRSTRVCWTCTRLLETAEMLTSVTSSSQSTLVNKLMESRRLETWSPRWRELEMVLVFIFWTKRLDHKTPWWWHKNI